MNCTGNPERNAAQCPAGPTLWQDVGLIFLSLMASSIAGVCTRAGLDAHAALGTSLLTMAVSTALVGLGLMAVGEPLRRSGGLGLGAGRAGACNCSKVHVGSAHSK